MNQSEEIKSAEAVLLQNEDCATRLKMAGQYENVLSAMNQHANQFKREWVSVKDRLPEKEGSVLACTYYDKIVTAYFMSLSNEWDISGFDGAKDLNFITHWQPLPTPPKVKQ